MKKSAYELKVGLAEMLKGGVIMDVTNHLQAKIAEDAGAVAVMALERMGYIIQLEIEKTTGNGRIRLKQAKPFDITKRQVWEAYKQVKANNGAAGVDG